MTTRAQKSIKIGTAIFSVIVTIVMALWWTFGVAANAKTAAATASAHTPRIAAVEQRVDRVEVRQEERHNEGQRRFDSVDAALRNISDKMDQ